MSNDKSTDKLPPQKSPTPSAKMKNKSLILKKYLSNSINSLFKKNILPTTTTTTTTTTTKTTDNNKNTDFKSPSECNISFCDDDDDDDESTDGISIKSNDYLKVTETRSTMSVNSIGYKNQYSKINKKQVCSKFYIMSIYRDPQQKFD